MIRTALEQMTLPPTANLLDWSLLDVRPDEGWLKVKFNGKPEFCNPRRIRTGRHLVGHAGRYHEPGGVRDDGRQVLSDNDQSDREFPGSRLSWAAHCRSKGHPDRQDDRFYERQIDGQGRHCARDSNDSGEVTGDGKSDPRCYPEEASSMERHDN